jgi:hypothetical protein
MGRSASFQGFALVISEGERLQIYIRRTVLGEPSAREDCANSGLFLRLDRIETWDPISAGEGISAHGGVPISSGIENVIDRRTCLSNLCFSEDAVQWFDCACMSHD